MFTDDLKRNLHNAAQAAAAYGNQYVTAEHLLLMLINTPEISSLMKNTSTDIENIKRDLNKHIESLPRISYEYELRMNKSIENIVNKTLPGISRNEQRQVDLHDALLAIYTEDNIGNSYAADRLDYYASYLMKQLASDLAPNNMRNNIEEYNRAQGNPRKMTVTRDGAHKEKELSKEDAILEEMCTNLNKKAKDGGIDPVIGRDEEIKDCLAVLRCRRENNPLLLGEPGVGKTAIAEGIAKNIVEGNVPEEFKDFEVYSLNVGDITAGTKYRGQFEKKLKDLLAAIEAKGNVILLIDEIHQIIGAGSAEGSADLANIIKPALSQNNNFRVIGATTQKEYEASIEKDKALNDRFGKIIVKEPSIEETIGILQGVKKYYEKLHKVKYTDKALETATKLAQSHLKERMRLPRAAIKVIDSIGGSLVNLKKEERPSEIDEDMIFKQVAKMANVSEEKIRLKSKSAIERLLNLEESINAVVFDQKAPAKTLADAALLAYAGPANKTKTMGNFLFTGPTGTGKTEMVKQLSEKLDIPVHRLNMSQYMDDISVSKIIGTSPGYVGYEEGGAMIKYVRRNPECILLLDEIEKANPKIFDFLLGVMDEGKIQDNKGEDVDFSNVMIVMTGNSGASAMGGTDIGFSSGETTEEQDNQASREVVEEALKKTFRPEFLNRITEICHFNYLTPETIRKIVSKSEKELNASWSEKDIKITFTDAASDYLADKGYNKEMGARPLERLIAKEVELPIARESVKEMKNGGQVTVDFNNGAIELNVKPALPVQDPAKEQDNNKQEKTLTGSGQEKSFRYIVPS